MTPEEQEVREEIEEIIRQFYWFSREHPKKGESINIFTLTKSVATQILANKR